MNARAKASHQVLPPAFSNRSRTGLSIFASLSLVGAVSSLAFGFTLQQSLKTLVFGAKHVESQTAATVEAWRESMKDMSFQFSGPSVTATITATPTVSAEQVVKAPASSKSVRRASIKKKITPPANPSAAVTIAVALDESDAFADQEQQALRSAHEILSRQFYFADRVQSAVEQIADVDSSNDGMNAPADELFVQDEMEIAVATLSLVSHHLNTHSAIASAVLVQSVSDTAIAQSDFPVGKVSQPSASAPQMTAQRDLVTKTSAAPQMTTQPLASSPAKQPIIARGAPVRTVSIQALMPKPSETSKTVVNPVEGNSRMDVPGDAFAFRRQSSGPAESKDDKDEETLPSLNSIISTVEAFQPKQLVEGSVFTQLTREGIRQPESEGWVLTESSGYMSTVLRRPVGYQVSLPLLSENNFSYFAKIKDVTTQASMGSVFGTLPYGWSVALSARSEKVMMLGADSRYIDGNRTSEVTTHQHFIFLNAAPGVHLLTFYRPDGVGIPATILIMPNRLSYVDATQRASSSLSGQVLDGAAKRRTPLVGARVSWVGDAQNFEYSDLQGRFALPTVESVLSHPLYVEVKRGDGFKHRYRMSLERNTFYYFENPAIEAWLGALDTDGSQNSISPESGLLIAAFPSLSGVSREGEVSAALKPMSDEANLVPEVYSIGIEGRLEPAVDLDTRLPRVLGVQIPENANLLKITESGVSTLYSEWIVAQPGIVNVVVQ